jgi:hypothetical protein
MKETRTARAQATQDAMATSAILGCLLLYALYEIDTRFMGACGWVLVYPGMFYWTWRQYTRVHGWGVAIVIYIFITLPLVGVVHCFNSCGCPIYFKVPFLAFICMLIWVISLTDGSTL